MNIQDAAASFPWTFVAKIFLKADLMDQQKMTFSMTLTYLIYLSFFLCEGWKYGTLCPIFLFLKNSLYFERR